MHGNSSLLLRIYDPYTQVTSFMGLINQPNIFFTARSIGKNMENLVFEKNSSGRKF
jgi:hypothetical protein